MDPRNIDLQCTAVVDSYDVEVQYVLHITTADTADVTAW